MVAHSTQYSKAADYLEGRAVLKQGGFCFFEYSLPEGNKKATAVAAQASVWKASGDSLVDAKRFVTQVVHTHSMVFSMLRNPDLEWNTIMHHDLVTAIL